MKTANKTLLTILILAFAYSGYAQYSGASVGYMKVKPGQESNYLELEKVAKRLHQARLDNGIITQWHLYRKMYSGADDPYHFIVISFFDDYNKTESSYPQELIDEIYTPEEQAEWWKKASESRILVKSEFYDRVMQAEGGKPAKYIRINSYKVKQGERGTYVDLRRKFTKPVFEEYIKGDYMAGWSLWEKLTHDQKFQFVSIDAFSEFGQWKSERPGPFEYYNEVHSGEEIMEIPPNFVSSRILVASEYWKLIDFVAPGN